LSATAGRSIGVRDAFFLDDRIALTTELFQPRPVQHRDAHGDTPAA
jgi:hypothetical protein